MLHDVTASLAPTVGPLHEAIGFAVDRHAVGPGANRVAPDHERRTGWRAGWLDVEVGQASAFARQSIEARCWRTSVGSQFGRIDSFAADFPRPEAPVEFR